MPLLLSEHRFFIWDMVEEMWNRIAVLNPFWFIHIIEIFMNTKSRLSGRHLYAQCLPIIQGTRRSSGDWNTPAPQGHCSSRESWLHGHGAVMISLLFQAPPLQRYNRNRFQGGIWKACSMTSSCVWFQFVPTGDPAVLFFLPDPDMLCLHGCPVPSLAL